MLNASKNRMVDLKPLDMITSLNNLDISHNLLQDLHDVIDILSRIPGLKVNFNFRCAQIYVELVSQK